MKPVQNLYREIICIGAAHVLLFWHPNGLPIEDIYDCSQFRGKGRRLGQVLLFQNGGSSRTMVLLLQKLWERILELGLTDILILCHPSDVKRFERLEFHWIEGQETRPAFSGGNRTIAMWMDVEQAKGTKSRALKDKLWPGWRKGQ